MREGVEIELATPLIQLVGSLPIFDLLRFLSDVDVPSLSELVLSAAPSLMPRCRELRLIGTDDWKLSSCFAESLWPNAPLAGHGNMATSHEPIISLVA